MQNEKTQSNGFSTLQKTVLLILRLVIGWHFLYEGISKLLIPDWTSAGYLENSRWIFSGFFHWIASDPVILTIVDWMNIIGLILIGLALVLGVFTRVAGLSGIFLLALYYVANPPFIGTDFGIPVEGHYLFINKNLVEMIALIVLLVFPTTSHSSLENIFRKLTRLKAARPEKEKPTEEAPSLRSDRRQLLKNLISLPILGVFAYGAAKKYRWESVNAITGATIQLKETRLKDLKGELPKGKIGDFEISRLTLGGNLIGGWAHARDLLYANQLFKSYNTDKKVFETLEIAEMSGVNTMNATPGMLPLINKYKRVTGGKLQTVCQVYPVKEDVGGTIHEAMDNGADMIQIQGNRTDWLVRDGEMDVLFEAMELIRGQGYLYGLGAHSIQALQACDEAGLLPDFYMKTLHHDQYWSAHPRENRIPFSVDGERSLKHDEFHDNMFCLFPDESIEFMKKKNIPWIAFKVLAGGAIHPDNGFEFAFENGADFLCVGMFDWQVVEDVNVAIDVLSRPQIKNRERKWMG
jgi:uncharacterized membrane protein YphA (DoxX/SURF4 family)